MEREDERPNLRPRLIKAEMRLVRLYEAIERAILILNRQPDNLGDAEAIETDARDVLQEALKG